VDHLGFLASNCNRLETRLTVVYIPHRVAVNPLYLEAQNKLGGAGFGAVTDGPLLRAQQQHLLKVTQSLGIAFLDTTDAFVQAEKSEGRLFWPIDGHCNAAGYRLVAEACARHWNEEP